ncbi:MAG: competence/damage-inducible protein A [Bacteroidia bacterium]|nr:competence/damage-inducible protein A [Bacteroidia bacterium]
MKASIVTIGDEILIGQIIDTNSAWLGQQLTEMGVEVLITMSISDKKESIIKAIKQGLENSELVILTGGLGPTKDDITKVAIAETIGADMYFDEKLYQSIKQYFNKVGFTLTKAHKLQCYMPQGVRLLTNKMGTAPGMLFNLKDKMILSLPGVPYEMKWIFENSFRKDFLNTEKRLQYIEHRTIRTIGIGETRVEEIISDITDHIPPGISVAFLPGLGEVKVRLTLRGNGNKKALLTQLEKKIIESLGKYVYASGRTRIEEALNELYTNNGKSLAVAESCTGGHLAHKLTSISGSSRYFIGGIVAYDNSIKENVLGVESKTLESYGAVSEETVIEMLEGILGLYNADTGVAISGIAGPTGGTPVKPVGTIWLAWGTKEKKQTEKLQLGKDRLKNIEYTTVVAMNRLRLLLTHQ